MAENAIFDGDPVAKCLENIRVAIRKLLRQFAVKVAVDYISFPFQVEYSLHGLPTVDCMVVEWVMMVVE